MWDRHLGVAPTGAHQRLCPEKKFPCANSPYSFSSLGSAVKHFGQPIPLMPREDWPAWDRVKKAYFTLLYRGAPNFAVAAKASRTDGETVSSNIDNGGIPRKKHKRKGKMAPAPEELWRMVEAAEAASGTPGNLSVTPLTAAAPAPESASILVPLEGEPDALKKLAGLYPNLQVTVTGRLRVES
jgi:hypothetical protein